MVYVISKDNHPLMPCSNAIARVVVEAGESKSKKNVCRLQSNLLMKQQVIHSP